jgi:hypothetical protein
MPRCQGLVIIPRLSNPWHAGHFQHAAIMELDVLAIHRSPPAPRVLTLFTHEANSILRQRILTIPSKLRTPQTDTPTNFLKYSKYLLYCLQASVRLSCLRNNWLVVVLASPVYLERPAPSPLAVTSPPLKSGNAHARPRTDSFLQLSKTNYLLKYR